MKVLNLCCVHDHGFEGWFGSEEDFQSQFDRGRVECPMCGSRVIHRLPTAPRLNVSGARAPAEPSSQSQSTPAEAMTMQSRWLKAVQHVMANTVDVGERFADEARRMHYGETEEQAIRGRASRKDALALQEEGIEVIALPVPDAAKGTVQ